MNRFVKRIQGATGTGGNRVPPASMSGGLQRVDRSSRSNNRIEKVRSRRQQVRQIVGSVFLVDVPAQRRAAHSQPSQPRRSGHVLLSIPTGAQQNAAAGATTRDRKPPVDDTLDCTGLEALFDDKPSFALAREIDDTLDCRGLEELFEGTREGAPAAHPGTDALSRKSRE
jgi:hypothetical protein